MKNLEAELRSARDELARLRAEHARTTESLRNSEEFSSRLIACSRDCIKVLDLEGRLLKEAIIADIYGMLASASERACWSRLGSGSPDCAHHCSGESSRCCFPSCLSPVSLSFGYLPASCWHCEAITPRRPAIFVVLGCHLHFRRHHSLLRRKWTRANQRNVRHTLDHRRSGGLRGRRDLRRSHYSRLGGDACAHPPRGACERSGSASPLGFTRQNNRDLGSPRCVEVVSNHRVGGLDSRVELFRENRCYSLLFTLTHRRVMNRYW